VGKIILSCSGLLLFPGDVEEQGDKESKEVFSSPASPLPDCAVILPENKTAWN